MADGAYVGLVTGAGAPATGDTNGFCSTGVTVGLGDGYLIGTTVGCGSTDFVPEKFAVGADDGSGVGETIGNIVGGVGDLALNVGDIVG